MSGAFASGRDAIAICDRCHHQFPYLDLMADGDQPGLRVCKDCWDPIDPWKLPQRDPEAIALRFPRPDVPLTVLNAIALEDGFTVFGLETGGELILEIQGG